MAIADGSQTRIAVVAETTYGTTPSTPTLKVLRARGSSLRADKTVVTSEEIRADRNVADEILVGMGASGGIDFELSYGTLDDLLSGALCADWATNVLKNGVTPKFFTVEETIEAGVTDTYSRFTGMMVDRFSMDLTSRAIVKGSVSFKGKQQSLATSAISGATYTAANTKAIQAAPGGIASLNVASLSPRVRSLSLEINNNLRERPVIDSLYSEQLGLGQCSVTGEIEMYFESNAVLQAVLDHGSGALSFTVGSVTNEKYTFLIPKIIFGNGAMGERNNTSDVMVRVPYRGVFDTTEAASIKITRAVA